MTRHITTENNKQMQKKRNKWMKTLTAKERSAIFNPVKNRKKDANSAPPSPETSKLKTEFMIRLAFDTNRSAQEIRELTELFCWEAMPASYAWIIEQGKK